MLDPLERAALRRARAALDVLLQDRRPVETDMDALARRVEQLEQRIAERPEGERTTC